MKRIVGFSIADHAKDETFELVFDREKYEIDDGILEGKYKDWQKKLHPDLVHNKSKIMELREAIAEANDSNELNQIRSQVQEKLKQWSDSFVEAFESQKFDEAVKCIQRMTYYEKACEEIVKKL